MVLGLFRKKKRKKSSARGEKRRPRAATSNDGQKSSAPKSTARHASGAVSPRSGGAARNRVYTNTSSRRRGVKKSSVKKSSGGSGGWFRRGLRSRVVWAFLLRLTMAGVIIGGLAIMYFIQQLPDIRSLDTIRKQQGITIATADGRVIANYGDVYGEYIPYEKIPKPLIYAVIATEDRRFFLHHGVDFFGIARAMMVNAARGHVVQGGSTVTQQVAKNVFLTPKRTLERKIQEVLLAFWLEGRFSKQEIMAIYLNRVYLGAGAYGIDAASKRYFNKPATQMNLAESALMAGLLKAPSRYSPAASATRAKARIKQVLLNMVDAGYLEEEKIKPALSSFEKSPAHDTAGGDVRYYTDWIMDDIPGVIGNVEDDLIVTTSFDPKLQGYAVDAVQNTISLEGEKKKVSQGALVAMAPDGAVRAIVGGTGYEKSQYNRATQAKRQPGSVFKLFVYLAALEAGLTPQSTVLDAPVYLQVGDKVWSPGNYDQNFKGEIPMVQALRESLNTVSVRLSQYAGVGRVAEMAKRLGVPEIPAHPSIALGSVEATLLDMTGGYAHLANGGKKVVPYGILSITTRAGKELYVHEVPTELQVLGKGTVEMMNYMLLDVVRRGTGARATLPGRAVAGKTGTSQEFKDAWFIGFTPQLVAGVWVGNDNNQSMVHVTGGAISAPIWHDFMIHAMEGQPVESIPNSPGSSEGLLPWLFGGSSTTEPEEAPEGTPLPEEMPFGHATPPGAVPPYGGAPQAPSPVMDEPPAPAPSARPPANHESESGDVLTPEFWRKLSKGVPLPKVKDVKVEYKYPGQED